MRAFAACVLVALGCSSEAGESDPPVPPTTGCGAGERMDAAGGCCAAGTTPMPGGGCCPLENVLPEMTGCCPAGSLATDSGCLAAGVPPELCPEGFVPDGEQGCDAVLPATPCPDGQMAIPGEMACREIGACGSGTWGDIVTDGNTEHVDPSYTGGGSDGSALQPWTTIADAVLAAAPGAVVALAEGTYNESVDLTTTVVRLLGRCPRLVEIAGPGFATVTVSTASELGGFALTGAGHGVLIQGTAAVDVSELWIHDTGGVGIVLPYATGEVHVRGTLIDGATELGLYVMGAAATFEESVVRNTNPSASALSRGIEVDYDAPNRGSLTVLRSVIERNRELGIFVAGADALIEDSVVRNTDATAAGDFGRGMGVQPDPSGMERASVMVTGSLISQNHDVGIFVSSADAELSGVTVRDTLPAPATGIGRGIGLQQTGTQLGANVTIASSLVTRSNDIGILVAGSDARLEAVLVRGTQPVTGGADRTGFGVSVEVDEGMATPSNVVMSGGLLEQNTAIAFLVDGSSAEIDNTVVRDTLPGQSGYGRAIHAQTDRANGRRASMTLRRVLAERHVEASIALLAADAQIDDCILRDTVLNVAGKYGRGITIQKLDSSRSVATIAGTLLERNQESGVFVVSADATIMDSVIRDTPGLATLFGDGVAVAAVPEPALVTLTRVRIERSNRAAISSFGGTLALEGAVLDCNPIDLNGEQNYMFGEGHYMRAPEFDDRGNNRCGCADEIHPCALRSVGLSPPDAIPP